MKKDMLAMILAGGQGSRLGVFTDKIVEEKLEEKRQTQLALLNKKNWFKNIISKIKEKFMTRSRT